MNLSDYVADFLVQKRVKHAFGITGGAIVYIFDSLGKNKDIKYVCTHHEQAAAMAADAYSRISGNIGVSIATSGPGATNLLTGICCSYFDSIPTLSITGQVSLSQLKRNGDMARQIGFQETEIVRIFSPVTKYAKLLRDHKDIKYELEKAYYLAKNGRPGPVLLDIPEDLQQKEIEPSELAGYIPEKREAGKFGGVIKDLSKLIKSSQKPIVIFGNGIKLAGAEKEARDFIKNTGLPAALTWAAIDLFPANYSLAARDFGITANKTGNLAVQNSDLVIALGTRLDTHQIGTNTESFARNAKKVIVDIDSSELSKYSRMGMRNLEMLVQGDVKEFLSSLRPYEQFKKDNISNWLSQIGEWKESFRQCPDIYFSSKEQVNPYVFIDALSDESKENDIIIPEAGCNVTWTMQGWKVKEGQRVFSSFNHSPMGYGLPASIGACFANNREKVISIIGDGGLMINEQELATISKHNLPIKIFVMNNQGYGMIRQTQRARVGGRYEACSKDHFHIPDITNLARAHGIERTAIIQNHQEIKKKIREVIDSSGPVVCDVKIYPESDIHQKVLSGNAIDEAPLK